MRLNYFGLSCFKIKTKDVEIIIDPYSRQTGLKPPSLKGDIVLSSHNHPGHNNIAAVKEKPFVITGPGEYEIKNIFIQGQASYHDKEEGTKLGDNTIYLFKVEGMWLAHLGDLGHKLTDELLEKLEGVDILFLPVGNKTMISLKEAIDLLNEVEPKVAIPMHYSLPKLKFKYEPLEKFLKQSGLKAQEVKNGFSLKKKDLHPERLNLITFKL
jgi:L-ascorbate metabolism protein UlaG (beta-lactamase superfamily)